MTTELAPLDGGAFVHHAFFYEDTDHYAAVATDFVEQGLAVDEAVLVAVPTPRVELLRQCAAFSDPSVQLLDMSELGRNPGRIISLWQDFVARSMEAGLGIRGIGEPVWAGRTAAELVECQWHEELLNLAFSDGPGFPLMCPYETSGLDTAVIDAAYRSHPFVYRDGTIAVTDSYAGAPSTSDDLDLALPDPPPAADLLAFEAGELSSVRRLVYERANEFGLAAPAVTDLLVAVNEVATNSIRHGGGDGLLRIWVTDSRLVCEVRDAGRIGQALVGRIRTSPHSLGGRGLWLVHQLCDLVEIRSGERGTAVRMSMDL